MDSQWLQEQFAYNPEKSKAGLARALGLEPPAISKILNGTRQIKAHEYNVMRHYFGLPVDGERAPSIPSNAYRLEALAGNDQGLFDHANEGDQQDDSKSWIIPADVLSQRTQTPPEQIKIFSVQESVMEPDYRIGEQVLVDLSDKKPSPPGAFIVSDGFGAMLRFCSYVPNSNPARVKVSANKNSFQTQTLDENDFKIIGRVIAKLQWI